VTEKFVEQDVLQERQRTKPGWLSPIRLMAAEWGISPPPQPPFGQPLMNGPPPIPDRQVGPCYVGGQFGHLKWNCRS